MMLFKETNSRTDKLAQLQASQRDLLFMADLQEINDDFAGIVNNGSNLTPLAQKTTFEN
jgi:hypothetical protein